ncbi:MAG: phosphoethanolamine--lipid A transferase [Burkholderiales bacterium]|jgi:lipid A ethanolaminephosphotransferase|nr:phosphoethanolamine--lipid A transferase [Burkholderiales bacterium]
MNWLRKFKSKLAIKSHWLILLAGLYFAFVLNLSLWRFVFKTIEFTGVSTFIFLLSLPFFIFAPLYLFFNLTVAPYTAKPVLIFLVLISSAANYFMYNLGVYIDADMIRNVVETSVRETSDLVTAQKIVWVLTMGVLPALIIAVTKIEYQSFGKEITKRVGCILVMMLVTAGFMAVSYKEYASFGRNNHQVRKLINTVNYTYATVRYFQLQAQADRKLKRLDENAELVPFTDPHITVLVFVLGEAARAENFSLYGYERETNPLLKKQDVIHFNEMNSCGTATAVSVPCMFSHMKRTGFGAADARYTENLLDILQTAGYRVIWRMNADSCKGVCDRAEVQDMQKTNNPKYCDGRYCYDGILLDGFPEILADIKQDTAIILQTIGSHGPTYYRRYPDDFKKFTPTCDSANIQNCTRDQIVNTYDNTILYTDYVVSSAIDMLKEHPEYESGLIYVSDHGESLGEGGIYLHGFPYKFAPREQIRIPKIIWMSEAMKKWDYIDWECLRKEAMEKNYTHDNLFHSITGLLEVKTHVYNKEYDIFKNCRTKELFSE